MALQADKTGVISGTLDLLTQDYASKSIDQNQSRLINMYLEQDESRGKYQLIAYPTAGLTLFGNTGEVNIRAMEEYNGVTYVVTGNKFGSVDSSGVFTQLGSNLSTSSGFAKISKISGGSDTNNQIMIIDGTNGYTYNIDTSVATFPITDVDFPQTCTDMTAQDEYILVQNGNSIKFNLSDLADTTTWAALDFASKIGHPDNLVGLISHKSRVWLFGNRTTEVWYNSGETFPFEKVGDVSLNYGLAAREAKVMCGDLLYILSQSSTGGYQFMKIVDFIPQRLPGSLAREAQLRSMTVSDCKAYAYTLDSHDFIDWIFPTDNVTFTYDATTGIWLDRQSNNSGTYGRFLGHCHCFCYNKSLIGDYNSGKIYTQTTSVFQEDATAIRRMFISPPLYKDGRRIFIHRLQIDVESNVGSNKTFTLEVSNDSGRTWETTHTFTIPTTPGEQLYTASLGSAFNWMFRLSTTDNVKLMLLGFTVELSIGDN